MTTTTRRFVYRQRSRESVEHVLRLHRWEEAIRLAYHGEAEKLCESLSAEGQGELAALIASGNFPKRAAPPDERTKVKQYVCALVRSDEKHVRARHGELRWGTRPKLIKTYLAALAAAGELDYDNRDPQGKYRPDDEIEYQRTDLYVKILNDLERGEFGDNTDATTATPHDVFDGIALPPPGQCHYNGDRDCYYIRVAEEHEFRWYATTHQLCELARNDAMLCYEQDVSWMSMVPLAVSKAR